MVLANVRGGFGFEWRVVVWRKESSGFAVERSIGLMGSATLPRGESSGLMGENRSSSHHLNKLLLVPMIGGLVGLTGGFVGWTVGLVGLFRGPLVVVGTLDGGLVEDTTGFAVKTVKVLGFSGCLVEWIAGWMGCWVGRFINGFRVVKWSFVWTGCLVCRFTNGFPVVDWMFVWAGGRVTNGFRVVE